MRDQLSTRVRIPLSLLFFRQTNISKSKQSLIFLKMKTNKKQKRREFADLVFLFTSSRHLTLKLVFLFSFVMPHQVLLQHTVPDVFFQNFILLLVNIVVIINGLGRNSELSETNDVHYVVVSG